jgi:chemotaxis protein MotB
VQDNAREAQRLLGELQAARGAMLKKEDALNMLADSLGSERSRLALLSNEIVAKQEEIAQRDQKIQQQNKELTEMGEIIRRQDSASNALRNKIAAALLGFEGAGLSIEQRNGKVYILLDESLLFQVGQSAVAPKGVDALKQLAAVLEANKEMNILVEGHTDNTGSPIFNWKLSTERALSITHILLANSSISPDRLTAAGRGQFSPLDKADTPEARRRNRRSEIILTPNLDLLFGLIEGVK